MYHQLTEAERYTLSVLKREGRSLRSIAQALQRSPSTISREVRRNATLDRNRPNPLYVPSKAHEHANGRRRRSRRVKHHAAAVYAWIEALLSEQQWSPEQIASELFGQWGVRLSHMRSTGMCAATSVRAVTCIGTCDMAENGDANAPMARKSAANWPASP